MTPGLDDGTVLAALDLGTNSFHLVVARARAGGFEVVTREKETVRLGHGGGDMKELSPDAIERGVRSARRMQQIADRHGATLRAIATSAVREAANSHEFLRRVHDEAGVEIEVVSGIEEARLIHLGVLQAVPAFDRRLLLVDIGGGSTEVLLGRGREPIAARSFKLGAVRLTDRFFPGGVVSQSAVKACRDYVRSIIVPFEREVVDFGFDLAVASSGTAETVARMVSAARGVAELRTYNCFELSAAELDATVDELLRHPTPEARATVPGLEAARADIIVAGALVLQAVARTYEVPTFTFSEGALREGVLLDTVARLTAGDDGEPGELHHLRDVSRAGIRALAQRCDPDLGHSAHVAKLALELFDATQHVHGLDHANREYLEAGALLANVGIAIAHSKHHLHSYYVIRNSELAGLTDHEIEIVAQVARYHRKSSPKVSHDGFGRLQPDDQRVVRVLAGLLRVAIGLDRSHDARVQTVTARRDGDRLVVEAHVGAGLDAELELYTARERADLLSTATGLHIDLRAVTQPDAPPERRRWGTRGRLRAG